MNAQFYNESPPDLSDAQIIQRLKAAAESDDVFAATRAWSMEKMRQSVASRGDCFDRKGAIALELDGEEVLRLCMCDLPATIGRGEKADFQLEFEGISRLHCRLERVGSLVRLCDAESKNGTRLNGKKINSEELCDRDVIQLGTVSLCVKRV
ncbi:FHA domain-containing protein [Pontiella sulfatireligans]|uniref:FHA domain-containing protein FhaA n=1 Tax=Pontiella sulfatireligans TaxID=2750658 RepID=A0A6C2UDL1_9BACT|nr:FHA domain-containing protein [Pontiella sulfatireligans]VGO17979.1 FHA domain-containing protein FhaA [Pontiella sulfatireligans]